MPNPNWGPDQSGPLFDWLPDWSDYPCAVIASGRSATTVDIESLRGLCRVIVVNNSFRLAPWADVLYAADEEWWNVNDDARLFAGMKTTVDVNAAKNYGLRLLRIAHETDHTAHAIKIHPRGKIGHFGNSGCQALNLAVQCHAKHIILIGFDFCGEHWHDPHKEPLRNPSAGRMEKWRARLDSQSARLRALGVKVINASKRSALSEFPKMTIDEALSTAVTATMRQSVDSEGMVNVAR